MEVRSPTRAAKPWSCNDGDIRNVACANDTVAAARLLSGHDGSDEEHHVKRIATIAAIVTAFAVVPSVAAAGNASAQVKAQVSAQVIGVQTAKTQRATAAFTVQRRPVQIAQARRFALIRAQIR